MTGEQGSAVCAICGKGIETGQKIVGVVLGDEEQSVGIAHARCDDGSFNKAIKVVRECRKPEVIATIATEEEVIAEQQRLKNEAAKMNRRDLFKAGALSLAVLAIPTASAVVQRINGTQNIIGGPSLWQRFLWWLQQATGRAPPPVQPPPPGFITILPEKEGDCGVLVKRHADSDPCGHFGTTDPLVQTWGAARRYYPEQAEVLEFGMAHAIAKKEQAKRRRVNITRLTDAKDV